VVTNTKATWSMQLLQTRENTCKFRTSVSLVLCTCANMYIHPHWPTISQNLPTKIFDRIFTPLKHITCIWQEHTADRHQCQPYIAKQRRDWVRLPRRCWWRLAAGHKEGIVLSDDTSSTTRLPAMLMSSNKPKVSVRITRGQGHR
jgi:hypothetical protein